MSLALTQALCGEAFYRYLLTKFKWQPARKGTEHTRSRFGIEMRSSHLGVIIPTLLGKGPPLIVITFWVGKTFENVTYFHFVKNPYNQHLQKCNLHLARYLQNLEGPPLIVITFWVGKTFLNVTYIFEGAISLEASVTGKCK